MATQEERRERLLATVHNQFGGIMKQFVCPAYMGPIYRVAVFEMSPREDEPNFCSKITFEDEVPQAIADGTLVLDLDTLQSYPAEAWRKLRDSAPPTA